MEENRDKLNNTELISLMQVYLAEWIHRDEYFWIKTHKYFYVTLLIILLPSLTEWIKIDLPTDMVDKVFPIIGIIMAVIFIYFTITSGKKSNLASDAYRALINMLPKEYRETSIKDLPYGNLMGTRSPSPVRRLLPVAT